MVKRLVVLAGILILVFAPSARAEGPSDDHLELKASDFNEHSYVIDNKWWPMKPGTRLTYTGFATEDGEQVAKSVVMTFTDLVKEIQGVRAAVMIEEDYKDKKLEEREIAFHAQDKKGNVWHIGQLRETYDGREFVGGRVFFAGHPKGAKSGIRMWPNPKVGDTASQGYAPAPFNWTDRGRVSQVGQKTKTELRSYDNVIVVEEWDAETPKGVFQLKYYAPGVGNVKIGFRGPDPEEEELELVKIEQLDEKGMAKAREKVLAIEERAYIYSHAKPIASPAPNAAGQ